MQYLQYHRGVGKWFVVCMLAFSICSPFIASAKSANINTNVWSPKILAGPLVTCTGTGGGSSGLPACSDFCDLISTFANVVYFFIGVVIWIITPIMVAWSGLMFILSQGNPGKQSEARKMITGVVIGLFIVLCAYLIVYTFISVLGITGIGGFGTNACPLQVPNPGS